MVGAEEDDPPRSPGVDLEVCRRGRVPDPGDLDLDPPGGCGSIPPVLPARIRMAVLPLLPMAETPEQRSRSDRHPDGRNRP